MRKFEVTSDKFNECRIKSFVTETEINSNNSIRHVQWENRLCEFRYNLNSWFPGLKEHLCLCSVTCTPSCMLPSNMQHFLLRSCFHALWRPRGRSKESLKKALLPLPRGPAATPCYRIIFTYIKRAMLHVANRLFRSLRWPLHG